MSYVPLAHLPFPDSDHREEPFNPYHASRSAALDDWHNAHDAARLVARALRNNALPPHVIVDLVSLAAPTVPMRIVRCAVVACEHRYQPHVTPHTTNLESAIARNRAMRGMYLPDGWLVADTSVEHDA